MSIKKSLLALAVMAIAMMGFASSAMAVDGTVVDVTGNTPMPAGTTLHFIGWAAFNSAIGGLDCHVTATVEATNDTTGHVRQFTVPTTANCTGTNGLAGCKLKAGHGPTNLPWHVTATATDFDVTGNIVVHAPFEKCNNGTRSATVTFSEVTLKPLNTVHPRTVTGTLNRIGDTAAAGEPIAGVEISGTGTVDAIDIFGIHHVEAATASGELELTDAERCTWKLS